MIKSKALAYLFIGVLLIYLVDATTIHGIVYDLSLKKVSNARVEINTSPKQVMVAQNGSYSFNAPNGFYTIKAQLVQKNTVLASVQENITINQDGSYVLDLILFPDVEEGIEGIDIDVNGNVVENGNNLVFIVIAILLIASIIGALYYYNIQKNKLKQTIKEEIKPEQKEHEDDGLSKLVKIIKNEGGRATQKEIRKQIPLSEAKISLMIAELEHKGVIEKIKKGRGNIIILKKK